jgi:high-affinity Fe2+/Pb2+ permease
MKAWIPVAFLLVLALALGFFYFEPGLDSQGDSSFELINTVGLLVVAIGVIAAGLILRRASPPK